MFEKIRPLGDRVLVRRMESEEKTKSGLFIPDAAKEKPQKGAVIAVGAGRKNKDGQLIPVDVKVDDIVYFSKYAGTETDEDYLIIREDEILGVFEN
jgi:chaperonin GroES